MTGNCSAGLQVLANSLRLVFTMTGNPPLSNKEKDLWRLLLIPCVLGCCSCRDPTQRFSSNSGKLLLVTYHSQIQSLNNFTVKIFVNLTLTLTVKLSIFKNKSTSHPEILQIVSRTTTERCRMGKLKYHRL